MEARPGSTHGYDIVDHNRLNPEIGSEAEFERSSMRCTSTGMGLILDFVPNHMGIGGATTRGGSTCSNGARARPTPRYFDINWDAGSARSQRPGAAAGPG